MVIAGSASAQALPDFISGVELDWRYVEASNNDYLGDIISFSVAFDVNGFILQFDRQAFGYDWDEDSVMTTLHLGYAVTDQMTVGVFAGVEDWDGDVYDIYGLEMVYDGGNRQAEVALGQYNDYASSGIYFRHLTVDASYDITDSFAAVGSLTVTGASDFGDDLTTVTLGGR